MVADVIKRIATMISYGMGPEEIHDHEAFEVNDEGTFFILYKAAEILAKDRMAHTDTMRPTQP